MAPLGMLESLWQLLRPVFMLPRKASISPHNADTNPHNKLESLPAELRLAVLNHLPDIRTLSALVHASPMFHASYTIDRERLLTKHTLAQMGGIGSAISCPPYTWDEHLVPCGTDIKTKPSNNFLGRLIGKKVDPNLESAILSCFAQYRANRTAAIVLSVEQCLALRKVGFFYLRCRWWQSGDPRAWRQAGWCNSSDWQYLISDPETLFVGACIFLFGSSCPLHTKREENALLGEVLDSDR